jgi:hypothetical protein
MIEYQINNGKNVAVVSGVNIGSVADMLDLIAEVSYNGCSIMIVGKEMLPEKFYSLKTGFAGEVLQKFSNYRMKLAIVGDFGNISSKSLKCFIYECNNGNQVFFKATIEEAMDALSRQ